MNKIALGLIIASLLFLSGAIIYHAKITETITGNVVSDSHNKINSTALEKKILDKVNISYLDLSDTENYALKLKADLLELERRILKLEKNSSESDEAIWNETKDIHEELKEIWEELKTKEDKEITDEESGLSLTSS